MALTGIGRHQWLVRQSRREYAPGRWMSDLDVLNAARLFDAEYPRLHDQVLSGLLHEIATTADLTVQEYARARLGTDGRSPLPDTLACWLTQEERDELPSTEGPRIVMTRVWPVWQSVDWRPAVLARLRRSDRWDEWSDLVAHADEVAEQTRYRLVIPPPAIRGKIFLRHWQRRGSSADIEMARRGFLGAEDLGHALRHFFAFDLQRGRT